MPRRRKTPKEGESSEPPATEGRPDSARRGTEQDIGESSRDGSGAGRGYVARVIGRGMDAQESGASGGGRGAQGRGPGCSPAPALVTQQGPTAVHQWYAPAGPLPVPDLPQADASHSFAPSNSLPAGGSGVTTPSSVPHGTPASTAGIGLSQDFERQVSTQGPSSSSVQPETGPSTALTAQQKSAPPVSSSNMRFPLRPPDKGQAGVKCIVKANHFFAELPDKDLHQYDVTISPKVMSSSVNRAVMGQLVELHKDSSLGRRLPVYDGKKSLYTAGPFPFQSKEFSIKLLDEDDGSGSARRDRVFKVVIKFAAHADLHHLGQFLSGRQADAPQEAIQVLDTVLRELPAHRFYSVGQSFYSPYFGEPKQLGGGLESCRGFYQSIRPTQMGLSLVIDMSSTAFIQDLLVVDFISQLLNKDVSRSLSPEDRIKMKKALRGVKVEATHRGNMRRQYRISGLTSEPTYELKFQQDTGTMKSVVEYFKEKYGYSIKNTALPCLQVGKREKPIYLPMEVCKIVAGQRYRNRLSAKQITALLKASVQRPRDREKDIKKTVHQNAYADDPYAREFGMKISNEPVAVEARVLPAPQLKYNDTGRVNAHRPEIGAWNMRDKKVVNGGVVEYWACINFSHEVQDGAAWAFCQKLALECENAGMSFRRRSAIPIHSARPDEVELALELVLREFKENAKGRDLELLVAILPDDNGTLYGDLKRICETHLGLLSQCCLTTPVIEMSDGYFRNLALKINVKVGGRNTVLVDALSRCIPHVSDIPTIIFGADVTHPHSGEDSSPSIASVVASQDWPEVTKYAGLFCAQERRQELIQDLSKMTRELLISFRRATGQRPKRIIFYRDGVSEGQFYQVLLHELDAIRKACASLEPDYQPRVTFVVVQKRHHTRLFANNHNDRQSTDKSGNILPGTVVDSRICHPTNFDFYLCSHAGIQGTSRPAYYYVLWDENKFSADGLQLLTYNLCYTYARCTRSVSIVPPAYYAHHLAYRARFYMARDSDSGSEEYPAAAGGARTMADGSTVVSHTSSVLPLPVAKMSVKCAMFYL